MISQVSSAKELEVGRPFEPQHAAVEDEVGGGTCKAWELEVRCEKILKVLYRLSTTRQELISFYIHLSMFESNFTTVILIPMQIPQFVIDFLHLFADNV